MKSTITGYELVNMIRKSQYINAANMTAWDQFYAITASLYLEYADNKKTMFCLHLNMRNLLTQLIKMKHSKGVDTIG